MRVVLGISIFAFAAALVGCGSDAAPAPTTSSAPTASASVDKPAPAPKKAAFAIVRVVDSVPVLSNKLTNLPAGAAFFDETVPIGTVRQEVPPELVAQLCSGPTHCDKDGDHTTVLTMMGGTRSFLRVVTQPGETIEQTIARLDTYLKRFQGPENARFAYGKVYELDESKISRPVGARSYVIAGESAVTEKDVVDAVAQFTEAGLTLTITLSAEGGQRFEKFTRENSYMRLAFMVDGYVVSAPVVQGVIPGGKISLPLAIGEHATADEIAEATRVANALAGANRPAPVPPLPSAAPSSSAAP